MPLLLLAHKTVATPKCHDLPFAIGTLLYSSKAMTKSRLNISWIPYFASMNCIHAYTLLLLGSKQLFVGTGTKRIPSLFSLLRLITLFCDSAVPVTFILFETLQLRYLPILNYTKMCTAKAVHVALSYLLNFLSRATAFY